MGLISLKRECKSHPAALTLINIEVYFLKHRHLLGVLTTKLMKSTNFDASKSARREDLYNRAVKPKSLLKINMAC